MSNQFAEGEIDLALFGGFTFVLAEANTGAISLVMRDTDIRYSSYFMVRKDKPGKDISELKGGIMGFGPKTSTSGHLMPHYFLMEKQITPETFFSQIKHSESHDQTAQWVRDGVVDVGVAISWIVDEMFKDGRLKDDEIRVLWETPPFPDYVWAIRKEISQKYHTKIRNAFFSLSPGNDDHKVILGKLNANYFIPASVDTFSQVKLVAEKLNLVPSHP